MPGPHDEYRSRLALRQATHRHLSLTDARLSYLRLAAFAGLVIAAALAWNALLAWGWTGLPLAAFLALVHRHDRVIRARDEADRAAGFYERGLARLEDRWIGTGEQGERFADSGHPYAVDLDLFGPGSLFELLSIARTRNGEATLAAWLMTPASATTIRERHAAVDDLAPRLDLREAVSLAGTAVRAGVHGEALVAWAESAPLLRPAWLRGAAVALAAGAVAGAALWARTGRFGPLVLVLALEGLLFFSNRARMQQVLHAAGGWSRDLDVLAHVLALLEQDAFTAPQLVRLRERLDAAGAAPARAIRSLHRLVEMHDWTHNMIFAAIAIPLLWDVHLAWAMEAWRARYGAHVRVWLDAVGEFEALGSIAAYRYEHPDDPYPEIIDGSADAIFDGHGLGHPLLAQARMIRNDVTLAPPTRLLLVSGSNMSGKSTLLRTIGINIVLAQAGAPVRAVALRLTPLTLGATLRIQDSLQEGRSRFYAEITRVRDLATLALAPPPLLFLLDELFHGTNSHDRLVGAAGVLRMLLDRGAIGLVTTHDLALTAVADGLGARAANVHFDDRFDEGEMHFDYRMKPGPVTRSNAIALMRAVGLDVGPA